MDANDGFVPITAIFFAVFHPIKGTKIIHQVPEGAIGSYTGGGDQDVLFNFDTVKNYIIPKPQLCNKFISFKINEFRVLGYPVNIEGSRYSRNSFNFNFGFVFPYNADTTPYESAITRMGKMFRALEEQLMLLSKLDKDQVFFSQKKNPLDDSGAIEYTPGHEKIQKFSLLSIESLIHQIYQDLNNYSECCIPIDTANSVDIKLFPILPPPVNLKAFQVPILTVKLNLLMDVNWDPTMVKIIPYINGLNSMRRISHLADADYVLTKQCIQHLMHYQCITMVDIFQFNNIYAPTNNIGNFLKTDGMAEECQAYIISAYADASSSTSQSATQTGTPGTPATPTTPGLKTTLPERGISMRTKLPPPEPSSMSESASPFAKNASGSMWARFNQQREVEVPSKATLFHLYRLLNQGQTIKEWYIQHHAALKNIDIRRFINFGVVRGVIYRVNLYPILHWVTKSLENGDGTSDGLDQLLESFHKRVKKHNVNGAPDQRDAGLLRNAVNETNLKMGKKKRTVSFNYNVDRDRRDSRDSETRSKLEEEDYLNDLDVFDSDSDESLKDAPVNRSDSAVGVDSGYSTGDENDSDDSEREDLIKLIKLVRGSQHMDSICTELQLPRHGVERLLDKLGPHSVINA